MVCNPSVLTDPSRSVRIIGAGYSSPGTLSMALALEKLLDGPVMHGGSQLLIREDGMSESNLLLQCHLLTSNAVQPVSNSGLRSSTPAKTNRSSSNCCEKLQPDS
jgi:hypothetical protein